MATPRGVRCTSDIPLRVIRPGSSTFEGRDRVQFERLECVGPTLPEFRKHTYPQTLGTGGFQAEL